MKRVLFSLCLCIAFGCSKNSNAVATTLPSVTTDSAIVTVVNGYGSGKYKVGDTVHIFSNAYADNQLFDTWSSADLSLLNAPLEWHTWFITPAKNITVTGSIKSSAAFTLQFEQIRGRDRM